MKSTSKLSSSLLFLFSFAAYAQGLSGTVKVDGSSTVFPVSEAMAEEFQKVNPKVRVTVGESGTGGGMKKFTAGEIDIAGASRPITDTERTAAKKNGIEYVELPIAYDGLSIVVNPQNTWAASVSIDELKKIWQPNSTVKLWSDVRKEWPKEKITLYGPGTNSGTFDYFTEVVTGKKGFIRPDFTASEDDNVLVQGVSKDKFALGYFGFAYWAENKSKLKVLSVSAEGKAVTPSHDTIADGSYKPLSRPLFIYVNKASTSKPEVEAFMAFYLEKASQLVGQVGYVAFPAKTYVAVSERYKKKMLGTTFGAEISKKTHDVAKLVATNGI